VLPKVLLAVVMGLATGTALLAIVYLWLGAGCPPVAAARLNRGWDCRLDSAEP